jgi:dCMP deaminase
VFNASLTGTSLKGASIYVYGLPTCSECAKAVIQSGIKTVVVVASDIDKSEVWKESWELSKSMLTEAGINIIEAENYE